MEFKRGSKGTGILKMTDEQINKLVTAILVLGIMLCIAISFHR